MDGSRSDLPRKMQKSGFLELVVLLDFHTTRKLLNYNGKVSGRMGWIVPDQKGFVDMNYGQ